MKAKILPLALAATVLTAPLAQARIETASVERTGGSLVITWSADGPVDVQMATAPDASMAEAKLISDDDGDRSHTIPAGEAGRVYFLLKDESDGTVRRVAERLLPLERGSNFRDLGGYPAFGGKHVRWGKIFRSGAMPMLSEKDVAYLSAVNIATVVDLRSVEERDLAPGPLPARTGAGYFATDYSANAIFGRLALPQSENQPKSPTAGVGSMYREWLISLAPQYQAMFDSLLAQKDGLVYHCSAGQDRTGVGTALVLSALGVPRDVILTDYHLSTQYRRPEYEMPEIDPAKHPGNMVAAFYARTKASAEIRKPQPLYDAQGTPYLAATFDEIDRRWGTVERYLDEVLGIDAVKLAALRAGYLE